MTDELRALDYWRAVVLYGANVATYKIALAACLLDFVEHDIDRVSMEMLAEAFFDTYRERLQNGKPQLSNPAQKTLMERVVAEHNAGTLTREAAITRVARQGFVDVVPRFHTVNGAAIARPFYEVTTQGLVFTNGLALVRESGDVGILRAELGGRWDLIEGAFEMKVAGGVLTTDTERIYREMVGRRVSLTATRPVLNAYQNGYCFYCGERLDADETHVDHVIPRAFVGHDEIWNLVLAHAACNLAKKARLPQREYLDALEARNEYYIASNHPIKRHLERQTGRTVQQRQMFLRERYEAARMRLVHVWEYRGPGMARDPLAPLGIVTGK